MNRRLVTLISLLIASTLLAGLAFYRPKKPNPSPEPKPAVNQVGVITEKKIILQDSGTESDADLRKVYLFDPVSWQSELLFEGRYRVFGVFQNHLLVMSIQPAIFFEYDFVSRKLVQLNFPSEKHWSEEHYQSVWVSDMFVGKDRIYVTRMTIKSAEEFYGDAMAFHPYERFVYSFTDDSYTPLEPTEKKFSKILSPNPKTQYNFLLGISADGNQALFSEVEGYFSTTNLAWVNLKDRSISRVLGDEYVGNSDKESVFGTASMNPSGTRIAYRIEREDGPHLELVTTDNISEPISSVLVPVSLVVRLNGDENTLGRERASAWIDDERVLISFDDGVALVDFSDSTVKEQYLDETIDTSYTNWDFYTFGSDGNRYLALTDWDTDSHKPCPARPKMMCPEEGSKSTQRTLLIDLQSKEQHVVGENLNFTGWISVPNVYRNEKTGIAFKYPTETQVMYSDEVFESEEGMATEAIHIRKGDDDLIYINHLSNFDIDTYRNRWKELDVTAANEKEQQISRGEHPVMINNSKAIRYDYCSYTLAGVNCDIILSHYLFKLKDGSYIIVKSNPWQYSEDTMMILSSVVGSFRTDLAE